MIEHVVGRRGGEAYLPAQAEVAPVRHAELAHHAHLVLRVPRRDDDGPGAVHHVHERTLRCTRARRVDEVDGHPHDLVDAHVLGTGRVVADANFGKPDVVAERVVDLGAHVGVGDRELEALERAPRERDRLTVGRCATARGGRR